MGLKRSLMVFSILFFLSIASITVYANEKPQTLTIEFLRGQNLANIRDFQPEFGWVLPSTAADNSQTAYRILVASTLPLLRKNKGDMWDSGKIVSPEIVNIEYNGKSLESNHTYFWKVKMWDSKNTASSWSSYQAFSLADTVKEYQTSRHALQQSKIYPHKIIEKKSGHYLVDFGKSAFGFLKIETASPEGVPPFEVHFGERGSEDGVNRSPGGTVRYYKVLQEAMPGLHAYEIHPPRNDRNTREHAIKLPEEVGIVAPFRYVELINFPSQLKKDQIQQITVHYPFDENAASFHSDNKILNQVWDLCKYSMKATSFTGIYVDGDRERIPYEADAYINQLSHYAVDREYSIARFSHEYLLSHPTWPTEWKQHSILMAWADYMYTGNNESLVANYDLLKSQKTLEKFAREDGLLNTRGLKDIVDWPRGERDNYDFREVNTVVNAFYYQTLLHMADLAKGINNDDDFFYYRNKAAQLKKVFNAVLFDKKRGIYIDGEGSTHASLHANMMPLAFEIVPPERIERVADFLVSRGMACSVYGAQYLLEALFKSGRADMALQRMTSTDLRSWYNMIRVGSTITLEAWDNEFKPNQDWNHAWGAAPANIISRFVLGVQPLEPGFKKVLIHPQPGGLKNVSAKVPTIRGTIHVKFEHEPENLLNLTITIPGTMTARVGLPWVNTPPRYILLNGSRVKGEIIKNTIFLDDIGPGKHFLSLE
ncbi:MAG: alpha-L-rhamnosidase [Calditrichaeota bacterium]|nr:MAG: alpha-L-rhamnosidase [Calditrichota bacterium]